ncbi:hypothetical protein K2Y11_23935 [bacterium]|nr:hypothetical protein [bacterium]
MSEDESFADLIARVRARDAAAMEEVFQRFGPAILRTARLQMFNSRLRRMYESADIANSVMKSFLIRIADEGNSWKIDEPGDLAKLLISMTDHKVITKIRRETAQKRGGGKTDKPLDEGIQIGDDRPTPEEIAIIQEEAARCWELLDEDTRSLFHMRYRDELSWNEIGAKLGLSGDASRKKLERGLSEVRRKIEQDSEE